MATVERQYTIPLRKEWLKVPLYRRAEKASRAIKEFLTRHMRAEPENIKIGRWLNEQVWQRGIKNPPHKVRVNVSKDDKGIVRVELIELSENAKKIQAKEDTRKKGMEEKKKTEEAERKAEEEKMKKEAEAASKKEEASKTDAEKEADKEEKKIGEKVKHDVVEHKHDHPTVPHEKHTKKTHPVRQALEK